MKQAPARKILNIGSLNIDYVYGVSRFVKAGETVAAFSRQIFHGGKGFNQSVAIARAGGRLAHAGAAGYDGAGLIRALKDEGVDTGFIQMRDEPSGHAIIQVDGEGQNCILLYPGANFSLDESYIDRALEPFGEGDIVVMQNEVSCAPYAMRRAKSRGMLVAFNPSPFGPEINGYPLECVFWFFINETEGRQMTGKENGGDIVNEMGEKYPQATIVLTLGKDGVICKAGGKVFRQNAYKVKAADTTAAGDTFTGYFIRAAACGADIEESLRLATKASAISVSRKGAGASIPTISEVENTFFDTAG